MGNELGRNDLAQGAAVFSEAQRFLRLCKIEDAVRCLREAERLGYDANECAAARWNCWMLSGQFELAWQESDQIARNGPEDPHRFWNGQSWAGKRVMLRCLHGLGDTIQFIRYAPLIRHTSSSLIAQVHPQLVTLIQGVSGIDKVITWGKSAEVEERDWEMQMEVTELPRAFRSTISSLPTTIPYIQVAAERIEWASGLFGNTRTTEHGGSVSDLSEDAAVSCALFPPGRNLRIGVAWQSGPWDPARSISLDFLGPLFALRGCEFYSLQKEADLHEIRKRWPLRDLEIYAKDVRDTAALILNLDLVVAVDTMTAHLAGALGRPVWVLLPFRADWRWMLKRTDSPWYPTLRLFRQTEPGNWVPVIDAMIRRLQAERTDEAFRKLSADSPAGHAFHR